MDTLTAAAGGRPQLVASVILSAIGGAIMYLIVLAIVAHTVA